MLAKAKTQLATWYNSQVVPKLRHLGSLVAPLRTYLRGRYRRLEAREKALLMVGGLIGGALVVYDFVVLPVRDVRTQLDLEIARRQSELIEVGRLLEEYRRLRQEVAYAQRRAQLAGKDFALFSVLESTLSKSLTREKIASISPSERRVGRALVEHRVEVKLQEVELAEIVDTLYRIEHLSPPVVVSNLRIKKRPTNPHSFDVEMTCFAVGKAG